VRVVVTGGLGRVGRYVVDALAQRHEVQIADAAPGALQVDIMDLPALRQALDGADAVVHLAAIDYDWRVAPDAYVRVNALGTWHLLQAAQEAGVRRVAVCSSVAAVGLHDLRPEWTPSTLPVTEAHALRPVDAYGVSKACAEVMARSFADAGALEVVVLRPCTVLFGDMRTAAGLAAQEPLFLRDYVTGEDVGSAFLAAVEAPAPGFGPYFVCADDSLTATPTLEWLPEVTGGLPPTVDRELYAARPTAGVFSNRAIADALGWRPTSTFARLRAEAAA
jgi:nucleoside-diphosphate-sugar epimerase